MAGNEKLEALREALVGAQMAFHAIAEGHPKTRSYAIEWEGRCADALAASPSPEGERGEWHEFIAHMRRDIAKYKIVEADERAAGRYGERVEIVARSRRLTLSHYAAWAEALAGRAVPEPEGGREAVDGLATILYRAVRDSGFEGLFTTHAAAAAATAIESAGFKIVPTQTKD